MRNPLGSISVTIVIITAFALTVAFSTPTEAKGRGGGGEAEGSSTGNFVFIAAGVAVIAGVTIYIVTKGKDDQKQGSDEENSDSTLGQSLLRESLLVCHDVNSIHRKSAAAKSCETKAAVSPFIGLSHDETFTVGLSFSF